MNTKTYRVTITVEGDDTDSMAIAAALDMWNDNTNGNAATLIWEDDEEVPSEAF